MILSNQWSSVLEAEFDKIYYKQIMDYLDQAYKTEVIYPPKEALFNALSYTDYSQVKVVILGQDPYHGPGQAHGLSFSVQKGIKIPPSLRNIYKELVTDQDCYVPNHGSLVKWANQGVLLLNSVLTVKAHEPASHKKLGWQQFTDAIIRALDQREKPVVFILWGNDARSKATLIQSQHHMVIESVHPSPLSASRGFFGSKPFSKANEFLVAQGIKPIDWQIENEWGLSE